MPTRRLRPQARRAAALALVLAATLSGCGEEGGEPTATPTTAPASPAAAPPSAAAGLCDRVSRALLRTATGADLAAAPAEDPGYSCATAPEHPRMAVSWRLSPPVDSLDEVAEQLTLDLSAQRTELPDGRPAWLLTGPWMDRRIARLVTIADGFTVMVDATSSRLEDRAAGPRDLARAARQVAAAYAG